MKKIGRFCSRSQKFTVMWKDTFLRRSRIKFFCLTYVIHWTKFTLIFNDKCIKNAIIFLTVNLILKVFPKTSCCQFHFGVALSYLTFFTFVSYFDPKYLQCLFVCVLNICDLASHGVCQGYFRSFNGRVFITLPRDPFSTGLFSECNW